MGIIKRNIKRLFNFSIFFLVLALLPGLPPNTTFEFEKYQASTARPLEGVLAPNNLLDGTERLFEGKIHGPEHLLHYNGAIYTGIHGGELVKIVGNNIEHVTKFGKACIPPVEEQLCGRVLGLAVDTLEKNSLIVVDTYYGIFHYNLDTRKQTLLVAPETVLDGDKPRRTRMMNSVAVAKNGDIYWTDSSSDFNIENGIYILLSNPSGRLFHYDRKNKVNKVLMDQLNFANGLALSPNEDYLVVAETASGRLQRYNLKGQRQGQLQLFADGLPGIPDNLTPDSDGIWVPMVLTRDDDHPFAPLVLSRTPWLRKFLVRLIHGLEAPFLLIEKYYPNPITAHLTHYIGTLNTPILFPKRATVLRLNWNGDIVKAYHGFDGTCSGVSHVERVGDYLYFGSPYSTFVGRKLLSAENLPKATQQQAKPTQAPTTTQRPTTTTPKPTTTTPKPTTTTAPPTTTTQRATTTQKPTTTTPKPTTTTRKPTTQRPATTQAPEEEIVIEEDSEPIRTTTAAPKVPKPAPIREERDDLPPPTQEKLKVIKKGGEQGEL